MFSMRDLQRISTALTVLEKVWREQPDLRLGQIIVTAANASGRQVVCPELFYLEDTELLQGITALSQAKPSP